MPSARVAKSGPEPMGAFLPREGEANNSNASNVPPGLGVGKGGSNHCVKAIQAASLEGRTAARRGANGSAGIWVGA